MFWRLLQEQSQNGSEAAQKFRQPLRSGREFVTHVKTYPVINRSEGEASEYILFPLPSTLISEYQQFKKVHQESDLGANISQGFMQSLEQVGKGTHHFHLLSFSPNHCFTFSSHSYSPGTESTSKTSAGFLLKTRGASITFLATRNVQQAQIIQKLTYWQF